MPDTRPLPTVIGSTENALRALLTKTLSTTRIKTYSCWVTLNVASNAPTTASSRSWQLAVAELLKVGVHEVHEAVAELRTSNLLDHDDAVTALGASELARGRSAVSTVTSRLIEGISDEEQTTARLVLDHVRCRAEELLRL